MTKHKKLVFAALLAALALVAYVIEAQFPPPVPIAGVKLGVANIFTLVALCLFDIKTAFAVVVCRLILGSFYTGNAMAALYSISGGLLCLVVMALISRVLGKKFIWVTSTFGAIAHNTAQLGIALAFTGRAMLYYTPVLLISAIITGAVTGITAQIAVGALEKTLVKADGNKKAPRG